MLITSDKNPTIKLAKALLSQSRQRKKHVQTVLEGVHLIDAAIKANIHLNHVLIAQHDIMHPEVVAILQRLQHLQPHTPILHLDNQLYQSIRSLGDGIDMMAMIEIPMPKLSPIHQDCLVLNDVQDCGNVGTLLRTAAAVGIQTILCTKATASTWSPKALRASMGANFSLTIYENLEVHDVISHVKVPLFATSSHTTNIIYHTDLNMPMAWVMGHEGQGVCQEILQQATPIALPQPNGQESLNVAIAGALCMYETLRQRQYSSPSSYPNSILSK